MTTVTDMGSAPLNDVQRLNELQTLKFTSVGFRRYTGLDLIRFRKFANELPELGNMELLKRYNLKHPEKTAKEQLTNLAIGLGLDDLHRKITGKEIPDGERWEDDDTSDSALPISDVVLSEAELPPQICYKTDEICKYKCSGLCKDSC